MFRTTGHADSGMASFFLPLTRSKPAIVAPKRQDTATVIANVQMERNGGESPAGATLLHFR